MYGLTVAKDRVLAVRAGRVEYCDSSSFQIPATTVWQSLNKTQLQLVACGVLLLFSSD